MGITAPIYHRNKRHGMLNMLLYPRRLQKCELRWSLNKHFTHTDLGLSQWQIQVPLHKVNSHVKANAHMPQKHKRTKRVNAFLEHHNIHTWLSSIRCAMFSRHSWPVLSAVNVHSIRVLSNKFTHTTYEFLEDTVYRRALRSRNQGIVCFCTCLHVAKICQSENRKIKW